MFKQKNQFSNFPEQRKEMKVQNKKLFSEIKYTLTFSKKENIFYFFQCLFNTKKMVKKKTFFYSTKKKNSK